MFHRFYHLLLLVLFLFWLPGCEQPEANNPTAVVGNPHQVYRIGLIPEHNIFTQKKRYGPLIDYLSQELGITLESVILPRYGNIIENFNQLQLDGAFFGSFTGAMAIKTLGVEPLARPRYVNGASTYYGMVFVKKQSNIHTAEDIRNKRMAFVDRATTAGYLLPVSYFKSVGIADYTNWLGEYYFSGTHEDAIKDVLEGVADIGAAKNTVFYRMAEADPRIIKELEILATSPRVPANGLALNKDIPQEVKQAFLEKLLTMHQSCEGRKVLAELQIDRFISTTVNDYQPVLDYAAKIGLDLSRYEYSNK
ncbi:phosphonate transport system substrate-binding protein [Malonomonas rubra DSM 5091]|uniref:Phosphonate transport system substrate-binding protein n=1 Tax=Malonomonas rubra DSM 5091 TaxID=1122189 RepID=A0A1M6HY33_MALRU|nr:phosphate/phosphite/phosphonate ABC transporter substrate-binding protein [Malonomonas rubra]SHJ27068.1 phosphonate transport system substrate-binding protein [Malonomonas rubra DSM 5091]